MTEDLLLDNSTKISFFNPLRRKFLNKNMNNKLLKFFLPKSRLNNFGDLLGPIIVKEILKKNDKASNPKFLPKKFLTIGSILHYASNGDHIWGSGINGKKLRAHYSFKNLNIWLVRGPLTRKFLIDLGIKCPEIFGDPGILFSDLFPKYRKIGAKKNKILFIPNYNEEFKNNDKNSIKMQSPLDPVDQVIKTIADSEFVISSSLHAIIIAESLGIKTRFLKVKNESPFKYLDYLRGTGRLEYLPANTINHAIDLGPQDNPIIDKEKLLNSFPIHLYS